MRIGTANIKNYPDMTEQQVRQDAKICAESTDICGMQEISPEDQPVVLDALRTRDEDWKRLEGTGRYETPIFYRGDKLAATDVQTIHLERGDTKLTAKNSAIVGARFTITSRPAIEFAVVNCHLITTPAGAPQREVMFENEYEALEYVVAYYVGQGLTVFVEGDLNDRDVSFPSPRGRWLVGLNAIDKIGCRQAPNGAHIDGMSDWTRELNSDHDLRVLDASLISGVYKSG